MTGWLLIALAGLLAFGESQIGVGVILPGEIMITGLAASAGPGQVPLIALAVVVGSCLGDQLNYWLGRLWGPRLSASRLVGWIGVTHWDRGIGLVHRHGALAVLVSRLLPLVRTLVPAVAGVVRLSAVRFALASAAGSLVWTALWVGAGAAAASLLRWSVLPLLVIVPTLAVGLLVRRYYRVCGTPRPPHRADAIRRRFREP